MDTYDLDVMARTLYGEAQVANEPDAVAIASVIMNRVKARRWPDSAAAVCKQKWQFSCWWDDKALKRLERASGPWFEDCKKIARMALAGQLDDPTRGATHYYATYIKAPSWAKGKKPCYSNPGGSPHVFFNDIDTKPPETAKEALDQQRPLARSNIMTGGRLVQGSGAGLVGDGTVDIVNLVTQGQPILTALADKAPQLLIGAVLIFVAYWFIIRPRLALRSKGVA
jgi:hypothetical protein